MRALVFSLALAAFTSAASAQPIYSASQMSCQEAYSLASTQRHVVIRTGPGVYDRFVASEFYCDAHETVEQRFAATRDSNSCFIGYRCVLRTDNFQRPY